MHFLPYDFIVWAVYSFGGKRKIGPWGGVCLIQEEVWSLLRRISRLSVDYWWLRSAPLPANTCGSPDEKHSLRIPINYFSNNHFFELRYRTFFLAIPSTTDFLYPGAAILTPACSANLSLMVSRGKRHGILLEEFSLH